VAAKVLYSLFFGEALGDMKSWPAPSRLEEITVAGRCRYDNLHPRITPRRQSGKIRMW